MPKRKVLIVEDEFMLYDELAEFFEEKGFAVVRKDDESAVDNFDDAVQLANDQRPDIAVLDIQIKGDKDGIDLGLHLKQQHRIPVIYLSAKPNPENLERLRQAGDDKFVFKLGKPLDKTQLWCQFYLALPQAKTPPQQSFGKFFTVKEIPLKPTPKSTSEAAPKDPIEVQTFFKWDDIVFIESYNKSVAGSGNNNALLHTAALDKGFVFRSNLDALERELPDFFVRFSQSHLVNFNKVTGRLKGGNRYLVGEEVFEVSRTYKARAADKISRLAAEGLPDFPEE